MNKNLDLTKMLTEIDTRLKNIESKLNENINQSVVSVNQQKNPKFKKLLDDTPVGTITYYGKYQSVNGDISSQFGADTMLISNYLKVNSKDVANIMGAFANEDRIDILKLLIKQVLTAKEIMEILDFPTTGKVYHHLQFMEKLGVIVKKNEKFVVKANFVACFVLMFASIYDIIKRRGD